MPVAMWYEIIGYSASVLIALSLMMNSIIRLRSIGLAGAILFSAYGFIIGAYPVAFLNMLNASIHAFYLFKTRHRKDFFRILEVRPENKYLIYFLDFNKDKIRKYFPDFEYSEPYDKYFTFLIIRNLTVAGVVVGERLNGSNLHVLLDFVIPEYRDFKTGDYVYHKSKPFFTERGIFSVSCRTSNKRHRDYLLKMGFSAKPDGTPDDFILTYKI